MSRKYSLIVLILLCGSAKAQSSLSDQINAVSAAQESERTRQETWQRATAEQAARVAAQQKAAQIAVEQQRYAAQQASRDQAMASQRIIINEAVADKRRNQNFEDQVRMLQLEQAKLQILDQQQKIVADKQRDQAYEDQLRDLEIKQKMLELKKMEKRVAREDDFIDHDFKRQDAATDVVQSDADSKRTLSEGSKSLLENIGTAAFKRDALQSK